MSLMRFAGRAMLASYFIAEGVKAVTSPDDHVEAADPIARKVVPLAQQAAPAQFAPYVPEETRTLVQLTGAAQVVGGAAFALGLGRRFGAGLLALSQVPHVIASATEQAATADEKRAKRARTLRNVALLGATMLASQDTQGKPSLSWRAAEANRRLSKKTSKKTEAIQKDAEKLSRKAKKELKAAQKQARKQIEAAGN